MSHLETHAVAVIKTIARRDDLSQNFRSEVQPGVPVFHVKDKESYGICLSRRMSPDHGYEQCEVLWSRPPNFIDVMITSPSINTPSRKLRSDWTVEHVDDRPPFEVTSFVGMSPRERIEVTEEYEGLEPDEVKALIDQGADVWCDGNGHVTAKRRMNELPSDLGRDAKVTSRRRLC